MANLIIRPSWQLQERDCTPHGAYKSRRKFLRSLGFGAAGVASSPLILGACRAENVPATLPDGRGPLDMIPDNAPRVGLPADRNEAFQVPERPVTDREIASSYNNYYEFSGTEKEIWHLTADYNPFPGTIQVDGLVANEMRLDVEDLIAELGLEERIYRFRCVEAWAMTVPWIGFPLSKLIDKCQPLSSATHIAFVSESRPREMPGIDEQPWYPWPYYEGLRMDEATNELAFVVTGMYGDPLPRQNGSPIRLILPWKYGYKSPKAIASITFTSRQPATFWNDLQPDEYSFLSNVNPNIPHPRWSQETERLIGEDRRVPTQMFNGYAEWVGDLYPDEPTG